MKIVEYIKSHPWTVGILVVGGGLTFIVLSGWFGGGGNATYTAGSSGPSDSQLAAQTQLAMASMSSQAAQYNATMNFKEAELAAAVATHQINSEKEVALSNIGATVDLTKYSLDNTLERDRLVLKDNQLARARESERDAIQLQNAQLQRAYESEGRYLDHIIDYMQVSANANITQQLLDRIPTAQVG